MPMTTGQLYGQVHGQLTLNSTSLLKLVFSPKHRPGKSMIISKVKSKFISLYRLNFWRAYSGSDSKTRWVCYGL